MVTPQWQRIRRLKQRAQGALLPYKQRFQKLGEDWISKLKPLCGQTDEPDWNRFRPLRLFREEDWSDWLAWLLGMSTTGVLANTLFGTLLSCDFRLPKTEREEPKGQERRADIVVQWRNGEQYTSVEVKLDDKDFEKTFETCQVLERWKPEALWTHTILIPEAAKDTWNAISAHHDLSPVAMIQWRDVAHGLRKCLWEGREPILWQAWAWCFCRSVEVRLLRISRPKLSNPGVNELAKAARWVEILEPNGAEISKDMKPEKKAFLQEGVRLYAEAKDIVGWFETEMEKLFKEALDGKPLWMQGHVVDKPKFQPDGDQRWLFTNIKGKSPLGEDACVECGLGWNVAQMKEPIIYAGLWQGNKRLKLSGTGGKDAIRSFDYQDGAYLYLPVPSSLELEVPLNRLFDAILRANPKGKQ